MYVKFNPLKNEIKQLYPPPKKGKGRKGPIKKSKPYMLLDFSSFQGINHAKQAIR